ncbi:MAG: hypothetical protein KC417_05760, partial [Myxococcales bacterium]|nr:hypothetical protein [Myxococcales bacterium]
RTSRAARVLDAFIATHSDAIRVRARTVTLRHRGTHHDLALMFHELNEAWFESKVDARITWGAVPAKKRRRSIRLGTYAEREHLIRIHPALDQAWVPDYVVRTVVHHEMLHAALPAVIVGDRKIFHTREFRRRERAFPEFERATAWEDANIDRLLRGISR